MNTKQDISTAVNYNNISNCITYIPQDIKLELNNGILTLKAGSKVYIPNGKDQYSNNKFDVVTIDSDLSIPKWNNTVPGLISITSNRETWVALLEQQYSGISAPTSQYALWYDTSNNKIKSTSNAGSTWAEGYCFPIAICIANSSKWISIDQIFNGFGYIGNTVYALPGVKGLIPNGRNADGSLKNIEFTLDKVRTTKYEVTNSTRNIDLNLYENGEFTGFSSAFVFKQTNTPPRSGINMLWYNTETNVYKYTNIAGNAWVDVNLFCAGNAILNDDGKVSSLIFKTAFHALDYNDKSTISGWSMPSTKYIDLTLGSNGSAYIAQGNGYLYLKKNYTAINQYIWFKYYYSNSAMENSVMDITFWGSNNGFIGAFIPVRKGSKTEVYYNADGDTLEFRFIFAEGEV